MAIQYYMRAYNTNLSKYVDWVVNDAPDSVGTFSGYPTNQLINITINRIVQSKIANFLKQNQSLGGTDGYYFHVNSYDWKNAVAPIAPPNHLVGFAVENGLTALSPSSGISGATNASPIVIILAAPPTVPLVTGQIITVIGVTGNTNANGTWPITVVDTTHFSLGGSTGNGAYTGGGNAFLPTDMPTLTWDPINSVWRFVLNTNGDGVTLGLSQSVKVNNFIVDGYAAFGFPTASQGIIRLPNNQYIFGRNSLNTGDVQAIGIDNFPTSTNFNRIKLGGLTTDFVFTPGNLGVDGYIQHNGQGGLIAATSGFINDKNNTTIVAFRNAAGTLDIAALSSNVSNNIIVGDAINTGVFYNTSTANIHQFQVNTVPSFEIGTNFARFPAAVSLPTILQTSTAVANATGQTLSIQAQNSTSGTTVGGLLSLTSGTGTSAHGTVDINTGGILKARFFPTVASTASDNNSIQFFENLFRVDTAQVTPLIRQDTSNSLTIGNTFTLQAQNTSTASSVGGALNLTSGTGTTNAGQVIVQTGGVNQIIVSPLTIAPGNNTPTTGTVIIRGNLEVVGTTTTVDSTVVDIIGRVIHGNWSDPIVSPNVSVPVLNVGYSVHRGNVGGVPRDGAAWIWSEGTQNSGADGYWRAVTHTGDGFGTDNFTFGNSPFTVGVLGSGFTATSDPNPVNGYLPNVGGLRNASNTTAISARNTNVLTTISAASNLAALPQATINVTSTTGFTTNGGSLLIISNTGPQTVTYTGTTANTFTGAAGGSGTLALGSTVAQTNASTTIAVASNGAVLPQATINVATTVGFPLTGTIRIQTNGASGGVQTITYTGTTGTTFTGCTGGLGTLATGNYVNSPPIAGVADILLLGTDFGNRITHGDGYAPNNSGHIFSTTTGSIFDFWINAITQLQVSGIIDPADGHIATLGVGPTVNSPKLYQIVQPNTGANNGFNFKVAAQAGQQQTGGNTNNNGGNLLLASGLAGTGGAGAAGIDGYVDLRTGNTLKMRVFATDASPVGSSTDDNSILYFESLFRVDAAQVGIGPLSGSGIRFRQDDTAGATGQIYTIQAQNAATTGGNLVLTSGFGSSATNAGQVKLSTGSGTPIASIDRVIVYPTLAPALPQGLSGVGVPYTEFRDTAQGVFITPVFNGISSLGFATTVTGVQIAQVATTTTNGAPMTIQAQVSSFNTGTGGNLVLIAGNETGTTSTGGNVNITSGTGTSTNGVVNIQIGGVQAVAFNNVDSDISGFAEVMTIASTIPSPRIFQASTGGANGQILALMAQTAATIGGPLQLHSGFGATNDGYINLTTGNTVKVTIFPTTAVSAANNNSILVFENKFRFDTAQVNPLVRQDDVVTASAVGQSFTLQAQNSTGTNGFGGDGYFTSGTGTTQAGNIHILTGGVDKIIVHPAFTEFRDTTEALRITPVSTGTTQITYASTVAAAKINQTSTLSATGAEMTVQAQSASTNGGNLILSSGLGSVFTNDGYVALDTGLVSRVIVRPTFTEFRDTAQALKITPISTGATTVEFASTVLAAKIFQANLATNGGMAASFTVQAQNETGTTSIGGDLDLISGSGTFLDGYVNLQVGGSTVARAHTDKFIFSKGWRRNVAQISSGATYNVLKSDDYLAVTTLAAAFQINLPATPEVGDTYEVKDATGNAITFNITISGNGHNVDGIGTFVLAQAYAAASFTYTGTEWSIT